MKSSIKKGILAGVGCLIMGHQLNKLPILNKIAKKYPKYAKWNLIVGSIVVGVITYEQEEMDKVIQSLDLKCCDNFHIIPVCPDTNSVQQHYKP